MTQTTTTTPRVDARAYRLAQLRHRLRWMYNVNPDNACGAEDRLHDLLMEAHKRGDLLVLMQRIADLDGPTFLDASPYGLDASLRKPEFLNKLLPLVDRQARDCNLPDPDYTFDALLAICFATSHDSTLLDADIVIDGSLYAHDPDDPDDTVITTLRKLFHRLALEADVAMRDARQFVRDIAASR